MSKTKKDILVKAYLSEKEFEKLREICLKTGWSQSKVMRQFLNVKTIKEAPPVEYSSLIRELRMVGNNLNQLALKANSTGFMNEKEIRNALLSLRETEKKVAKQFSVEEDIRSGSDKNLGN